MLLHIPKVLDEDEVRHFRNRLAQAAWADGRATAGYQSGRVKDNLQLAENDPVAQELSAAVRGALHRSALFFTAALPRHVFTPLFNCYGSGHGFGNHIDNAIRYDKAAATGQPQPVRTDLSATLFLSPPQEYDGGELVIVSTAGTQSVKLPAGDLILYPATSVHRVEAITRGERMASFFWIQSLVRDEGKRSLLFDLDIAIQQLNNSNPDNPAMVELAGVYHNLLRRWSDT